MNMTVASVRSTLIPKVSLSIPRSSTIGDSSQKSTPNASHERKLIPRQMLLTKLPSTIPIRTRNALYILLCDIMSSDHLFPVEPNPPFPRSVSSRLSEGMRLAWKTGTNMSCATRSPGSIVYASPLRFIIAAIISPR